MARTTGGERRSCSKRRMMNTRAAWRNFTKTLDDNMAGEDAEARSLMKHLDTPVPQR